MGPKRRRKFDSKRRKWANVSACGSHLVVLSTFNRRQSFLAFGVELLTAEPCWVALYQSRAEKRKKKRLALDVSNTSATRAALVHDVTDTDCWGGWGKNGSTHGRAFATFNRRF